MNKLSIKGLAIGMGVTWAIAMMFLGWVAYFGYGTEILNMISSLYIGFRPGLVGGIIGGIFGFIDGAIGGALIAYFYNMAAKKHR